MRVFVVCVCSQSPFTNKHFCRRFPLKFVGETRHLQRMIVGMNSNRIWRLVPMTHTMMILICWITRSYQLLSQRNKVYRQFPVSVWSEVNKTPNTMDRRIPISSLRLCSRPYKNHHSRNEGGGPMFSSWLYCLRTQLDHRSMILYVFRRPQARGLQAESLSHRMLMWSTEAKSRGSSM